jgi:NAD(P)-dependent dehydrogenase (short-subunit alcohol dehydrogenase family)
MRRQTFGRLVFVSSNTARTPGAGVGVYAASKAGIHALVESLAAENKSTGINVYAVLPGIIDTAANRCDMPDQDFNSWVKTDAIAEVIFALTQPAFDPVRTALIPVT